MCGIAGFSLSPTSSIKPRQLANSLLTVIEDRGYMASGFAYQDKSDLGYFKQAVPGSTLSLKRMPKDTRNVILHTRLATHGSTSDNRNNHPVLSPSEDIALVHNGVIYNHHDVRLTIDASLPDVDTSVIPAVLENLGVSALDVLDGDAAIAWFDKRTPDTLHLARYQHSPLTMAQVEDGSFIFASTEALLWRVLIQLDLMPVWMESANELDYFTIRDGRIMSKESLPAPKYTGYGYDYNFYRHQTAGAKGSSPAKDAGYARWVDGYGWDDWDDDSDYYPQPVTQLDDYRVEPAFYTKIRELNEQAADFIYYDADEQEMWRAELYLLAQDDDVSLIDYGVVKKTGELVSAMVDDSYDELF
jgi:asparagine synthetase B (glutamine-hydrolysing)